MASADGTLLWVMHNNLQRASMLKLLDRRTGELRRAIRLGGVNCHNPLFYRGDVLYLLSAIGGIGRLASNGSSTTLWSAGGEWFTKGLAVVDDVAYFGVSQKQRLASMRNTVVTELVAFDLVSSRVLSRTPLPDPGLINALSLPGLSHSCSWRACDSRANGRLRRMYVPGDQHEPNASSWLHTGASFSTRADPGRVWAFG